MTEASTGILGDASSLDMALQKRPTSQILEISNGSLVTLENAAHYVSSDLSVAQGALSLDSEIVDNARTVSVNSSSIASLQNSANPNNYSSIEYVSSPVIPIQEDPQAKFADGLVHSGVEFVEMGEGGLKSGPGPPLDFYLEVMPTTSANSIPPTTTYMPRHEHQTPKAQLLVRAYSDFIQPHEQQLNQGQEQQANQHHTAVQVHSSDQQLGGTEHSDPIMSDVLQVNFGPLEQTVIANSVEGYRKPCKVDVQKRHLQLHLTQKQLQSFSKGHLEGHIETHGQKILIEHPQHALEHEEGVHSPQIQVQDHQGQTFVAMPQHPQRYQIVQKSFAQQRNCGNQEFAIKQELHQENMGNFGDHCKSLTDNSALPITVHKADNSMPKHNGKGSNEQHLTTQHMPLMSRSGRPIRRRQEYIEYVNNQKERDDYLLQSRDFSYVKVEMCSNGEIEEEEHAIDDLFEDDDNEGDHSNDEDHDSSSTYNSNGKKSLPHKKRIARKLKNSKKPTKLYKCPECDLQFTSSSQLANHKASHHSLPASNAKTFACELCPKVFDSQIKFFEHLKSHYEPFKKHRCEVCSGEFSTPDSLQEHLAMHSREHFQCSICHKTFRKETLLEFHIKTCHLEDSEEQSLEKPYTCNTCPKSFRTQITLDSHILSEHGDNPTEFNCEDCYRAFKTKAKLSSHRKAEHKEEVTHTRVSTRKRGKVAKSAKGGYTCTYCPRTFAHKNSLLYHIRGHTGERPHQCEQCGKAFYAASALKVHQRLHSGEKPYKCEHCEKYFRQWGDLRYHTSSVHSDARQFQCEFCGKDFKRKYCLVVHRRIHTGEKKYKCEFCNKTFRASSYLQNHRRIHTGERPYPCPDCGKPFRVRSDMKRHRHTHMRDSNNTPSSTNHCATSQSNDTNDSTADHAVSQTTHSPPETSQSHHPALVGRTTTAHTQGQQVQILQGGVGQGPLIIAEGVQTVLGENQPIRIMVSGLPAQAVAHNTQPPPAHRHSQTQVSGSTLNAGVTSLAQSSPHSASNSTASSSNVPSDVLIMDEGNHQPINLNMLPRMIAQTAQGSFGNQNATVLEEEGQIIVYSC